MDLNKILIVQIGRVGDMVLTTPLFDNLKKLSPNSEITVLTSKSNFEIASCHKNVDKTLIYSGNPFQKLSLLYKLKSAKYNLWIDTKNEFSTTSKILARFVRPGKSLGFNFEEKIFDVSLNEYVKGEHCTDINLSPIRCLDKDFEVVSQIPSIFIPEEIDKDVVKRLNPHAKKRLLINLSASNQTRLWRKDSWNELLARFPSSGDEFDIVINAVGKDAGIAKELVEAHKERLKIYTLENFTLMEICSAVKHSDYIISPDTAVVHIASAFDKPTVGLFTNVDWNNKKFSPLSDEHKMLISNDENSLSSITAGDVYDAFTEVSNNK